MECLLDELKLSPLALDLMSDCLLDGTKNAHR